MFWAAIKKEDSEMSGLFLSVIMKAQTSHMKEHPDYELPGDKEWAQVIGFEHLKQAVREIAKTIQGALDTAARADSKVGTLSLHGLKGR